MDIAGIYFSVGTCFLLFASDVNEDEMHNQNQMGGGAFMFISQIGLSGYVCSVFSENERYDLRSDRVLNLVLYLFMMRYSSETCMLICS